MTQKLATVGRVPLFEGYGVPPDFQSDGCTHCREKWFGVSITYCCFLHDFQRTYATCSVQEADARLKRNIIAKGVSAFNRGEISKLELWFIHILAAKVWLVVKLTRSKYSATQPLPVQYIQYKYPISQVI